MATTALDLETLRRHVGRTQSASGVLHAGPANLLRLTLGRAQQAELRDGDPLPPAWLALQFWLRFARGDLREDGSPRDTGGIPAMPLPRRMFAGERVRLHRPLVIGESVRRETTLADLSVKSGGTGTLVFATVTSRVLGADGGVAVEDERRTVFREAVKTGERNQAPRRDPAPSEVPWRRTITPGPAQDDTPVRDRTLRRAMIRAPTSRLTCPSPNAKRGAKDAPWLTAHLQHRRDLKPRGGRG